MSKTSLPETVSSAIARKCGSIVSLSVVWEGAARKLLASGVNEMEVVTLIEGMRSPRNFDALVTGIVNCGGSVQGFLRSLRALVDESAFSLAAWFTAIEVVQARLVRDARSASPESIVGYIQCTAEFGAGVGRGEGLAAIVLSMLDQYGFEGQEGCATGEAG